MQSTSSLRTSYGAGVCLIAILVLAAGLRLVRLDRVPPGLNQDEAVNAYNTWCLLKTGRDQAGDPWPIFYFRALGGNSTTLILYAALPFQLLGGLNIWTVRLPSAFAGIATVLVLYWVAARLYGRPTGLLAAVVLALSPWHIQLSRWGHEASLTPLATCGSLALLLWAGFPLGAEAARPIAWRALVAGLLIGVFCYGYGSVRLFLPLFLVGCVLVNATKWLSLLRGRRAAMGLASLVLGVGLTFGPLAYQHVCHPEGVAKHARYPGFAIYKDTDSLGTKVSKVLGRYVEHFGPDFLFVNGDRTPFHTAQGFGMLSWYALPLMVLGLVPTIRGSIQSSPARVLLCLLLAYPAGDSLYAGPLYDAPDGTERMSMHALRSAPGLVGPVLLAAVGAAWLGGVLWRRNRAVLVVAATGLTIAAAVLDTRFLVYYFTKHARSVAVRWGFQADLVEVLTWLKPHWPQADAVFITSTGLNTPYIVTLVTLQYDPAQWAREPREFVTRGEWEHYVHFGKFHYFYDETGLERLRQLQENDRRDRIILVLRPWEARQFKLDKPALTVGQPGGGPTLQVFFAEI